MKIIVVTENRKEDNNQTSGTLNIKCPIVMMKADSSLLKDNKPLFVPDFTSCLTGGFHIVARISRLGKSIPKRFAYRYYDGVTVGLDVRADDVAGQLSRAGQPWDLAESFDGGAIIGSFIPTDGRPLGQTAATLHGKDGTTIYNETGAWRWNIDELIEQTSRFFQLRQGDLLFCGPAATRIPLKIGEHIEAAIGSQRLLDFNVR